ncbi:MAG: hypothetical protein DRI34_06145 [Deltaproteobacteria bacterium]|nr:MAG: hypothetical protein DRI34_06145 [Deltaproteobacteria bacterium]
MLRKLKRQDRVLFKRDAEGRWTIHFVAFFRKPLPVEQMGIVVLDPKQEAVAVAEVAGQKGQTSLATQITVDSTEAPGKKHLLRVYYAKKGKPIVLAEKKIVLK